MEKIPLPTETWKGLKKLEVEARRVVGEESRVRTGNRGY
jgi:hypothetical protein